MRTSNDDRPVVLEVRDIVVQYGRIRALHGISLKVHDGELVTLLGSNGAGKTTTMRAISGLLPLTSGSVWFDGQDVSGRSPEIARIIVVLPAPLEPSSVTNSPSCTTSDTPCSALMRP